MSININKPPPYPPNDLPPPYSSAVQYPQHLPYQPPTAAVPLYQNNYGPIYGTTATTTTVIVPPEIILVGACPACRIGVLEDDYTCLGILCAIFFFPIGILCCLGLKNRRCSNCGAYFG